MSSTTANKKKKRTIRFWAVAVWLFVWQAVSVWIGQEILLVSPVVVLERLTGLVMETEFWRSIGFSLVRILGGFFLAAAAGILAAGLSAKFERIREFFAPAVMVVKAVPVASFIILVLVWVPSRNLSVVISFLMVFPILYTNVLDGILSTDPFQPDNGTVHHRQKQFFKQQADEDNHHRPCKQIRRIEIYLGIVKLFPDGTVWNPDDLCRHPGFPTESKADGTPGSEKRQYLGNINVTDPHCVGSAKTSAISRSLGSVLRIPSNTFV